MRSIIHMGKKAPKGYREDGPSMHIGRGIWVMRIVRLCAFEDEMGLKCKRDDGHPGAHRV